MSVGGMISGIQPRNFTFLRVFATTAELLADMTAYGTQYVNDGLALVLTASSGSPQMYLLAGVNPTTWVEFSADVLSAQNLIALVDVTARTASLETRMDGAERRLDDLEQIHRTTNEPTGFTTRENNEVTIDEMTRTMTVAGLAGGDYELYFSGVMFIVVGPRSVQWTDVEGVHFQYIDPDGIFQTTTDASELPLIHSEYCPVAYIYWDQTNQRVLWFGDERHGITMDGATHQYLHETVGTQYVIGIDPSLLAPVGSSGDVDTHAQIAVSDGQINDEDLRHVLSDAPQVLSPVAELPVFYRSGLESAGIWRSKPANTFPVLESGASGTGYTGVSGRCAYNQLSGGVWTLTEVTNNDFVLIHVYATNDFRHPVVAVLGQATYATANNAEDGADIEILSLETGALPWQEFVAIATFIVQTSTSYDNAVMARFVATATGADFVDWRPSRNI